MKAFFYSLLLFINSAVYAENYVPCCYAEPQLQSTVTASKLSELNTADNLIIHTREQKWPVQFATDFSNTEQQLTHNRDDGTVSIDEVNLGFRKDWSIANLPFAPYLGGGVAMIRAQQETYYQSQAVTDTNRALGNWYQAGALFDITDSFSFSVNLEVNDTQLDINGANIKSKEVQTGISTTFKW